MQIHFDINKNTMILMKAFQFYVIRHFVTQKDWEKKIPKTKKKHKENKRNDSL